MQGRQLQYGRLQIKAESKAAASWKENAETAGEKGCKQVGRGWGGGGVGERGGQEGLPGLYGANGTTKGPVASGCEPPGPQLG